MRVNHQVAIRLGRASSGFGASVRTTSSLRRYQPGPGRALGPP